MQIPRIILILCIPIVLGANPETSTSKSIFDQFKQENVLLAELEIDFDQLESNRKTNEYQAARFSFTSDSGITQDWNVKVRTRGRFRRKTCDIPPLRLRFSKKELSAKGFQKHNSFKLVTHCMEGLDGDDLVLREYLTYELYNILTDTSLRAQLVKITYKDSQSKKKKTQYGILLEDTDLLADRLNATVCEECYGHGNDRFEGDNLQLHALFQYMIGNTDWSLRMNRNLKLLESNENGKMVIVPYDFDFSGLVNAKYAVPNADYKLKTVRERFFLGDVDNEATLEDMGQHFLANKQRIMDYVNEFRLLAKKDRKDIRQYLESFYQNLENIE